MKLEEPLHGDPATLREIVDYRGWFIWRYMKVIPQWVEIESSIKQRELAKEHREWLESHDRKYTECSVACATPEDKKKSGILLGVRDYLEVENDVYTCRKTGRSCGSETRRRQE